MDQHNKRDWLPFAIVGAVLVGMLVLTTLLAFGVYTIFKPKPTGDPVAGKKNAEEMVEFLRPLPEGFEFSDGKTLSGAQSFAVHTNAIVPTISVTIASMPKSSAQNAKQIVQDEMKSRLWTSADIGADGNITVGRAKMYYVVKKFPQEKQTADNDKTADENSDSNSGSSDAPTAPAPTDGSKVIVVYASKNIEEGEIIPQEALEERQVEINKAPVDAFNSVNAVVGQQAAYPIPEGTIVSNHAIRPLTVFVEGELIGGVVSNGGKKFFLEARGDFSSEKSMEQLKRFLSCINDWR
ncbi:MAG TPA: flagella basal body P-ring formation protein FlgA [Candidatus Obscuribacterales bacterium]